MEPAVNQIERIAREVIARTARAGNNGDAPDVERLVVEVLARIESFGCKGMSNSVAGAEPGRKLAGDNEQVLSARRCPGDVVPPGHRQGSAPATVLELKARVVTLSELEEKLDRVGQITVQPRAVITPAARDELNRRGIAIGYAVVTHVNKTRQAVAWGQAETNYESARLIEALARERITIEPMAQTGLRLVIDELGEEIVKGGKPAVLLTGQAAVALCLANRRRGVRAVMAQTVAATMQVLQAAGGNLLVVDPAGRSWFELKRLVGRFVAGAPYPCPAEYRSHLE